MTTTMVWYICCALHTAQQLHKNNRRGSTSQWIWARVVKREQQQNFHHQKSRRRQHHVHHHLPPPQSGRYGVPPFEGPPASQTGNKTSCGPDRMVLPPFDPSKLPPALQVPKTICRKEIQRMNKKRWYERSKTNGKYQRHVQMTRLLGGQWTVTIGWWWATTPKKQQIHSIILLIRQIIVPPQNRIRE